MAGVIFFFLELAHLLTSSSRATASCATASHARNCYVYKGQIYAGKNSIVQDPSTGLSSRVVLELLEHLHYSGVEIYTDKFYSSTYLFNTMMTLDIGFVWHCYVLL